MNRYIRAALAGAAGLLLALSAATTAAATEENPWPDPADCAVGAFTGHAVVPSPHWSGTMLELHGWIGPCPPRPKDPAPQTTGRFGFAYLGLPGYSPGKDPNAGFRGVLFDRRLRPYESESGPTEFVGLFDDDVARKAGLTRMPICLMSDAETRVACAYIDLTRPDEPTVTQVPVTDPRVLGVVAVIKVGAQTAPNCGTCL